MCETCGWADVVKAIEAHLERRVIDHTGMILATASDVIQAKAHVDAEMKDAVAVVLESRVVTVQ